MFFTTSLKLNEPSTYKLPFTFTSFRKDASTATRCVPIAVTTLDKSTMVPVLNVVVIVFKKTLLDRSANPLFFRSPFMETSVKNVTPDPSKNSSITLNDASVPLPPPPPTMPPDENMLPFTERSPIKTKLPSIGAMR